MTDIKNLTPARFRCTYTISCPSVHRLEDGRLLIVGKSVEYICRRAAIEDADRMIDHGPGNSHADDNAVRKAYRPVVETIGGDEAAILIHPDLLSTVMQEEIEKAVKAEPMETGPQLLDRLGTDAAKWAAEFRKTALKLGYSDMDEGWLIGWFANAIMRQYDESRRDADEAVKAERERCARVAYQIAEEADQGGKETPAGKQARKIGNAIRFSLAEGGEA
jgi:hypothetical protein